MNRKRIIERLIEGSKVVEDILRGQERAALQVGDKGALLGARRCIDAELRYQADQREILALLEDGAIK